MSKIDRAYQGIGEFVVTFQWIENTYREIGWFILDPDRKIWPPRAFRTESNRELLDKVTDLFCELVDRYELPDSTERKPELRALTAEFHKLREYRNGLLHSVFLELKAGGEVVGILRANPRPIVDTETGEVSFSQDMFSEESVHNTLRELAEAAFRLRMLHLQLVHWSPFDRFARRA
jgi:hypothetical protein